MLFRPDNTKLTAREVRAEFSKTCDADHATIVLNFGRPVAILTPLDLMGFSHVGPKDKRIAACRQKFLAALEQLRTH